VVSLPGFVDAFPVVWRYGLVVIAWRPGLLGVFTWNGALRSIINYTILSSPIVPGATIMHYTLYLAWFSPLNGTNGRGVIYLAIQPLPHPIVTIVTNTTRATTTTTTTTSTTKASSIISTLWRVLQGLPAWVVVVVVIAVVIVITIVLLVRRSRSGYDYYYFENM
jgi:magnesium-transporting ATPase (P-type)